MRVIRRIEITVETDEVMVIRRLGVPNGGWCPSCGVQAEMVTAEEAARLSGARWQEIARLVKAGHVHFSETPDGGLRICSNSLGQ